MYTIITIYEPTKRFITEKFEKAPNLKEGYRFIICHEDETEPQKAILRRNGYYNSDNYDLPKNEINSQSSIQIDEEN